MRINHNIAALNTYSRLTNASNMQSKSLEKLSSGLRINKAGDDAAGLAISEKMRGQISGLNQASRNAQDGISMVQTAEGALNETHSILQRMRELAVQSSNDTNTAEDRTSIQEEMNQLTSEITRIGDTTEFNTKSVINGDMSGTTGATGGSMTIDFTEAPADGDTFDLQIGDDTWSITVAGGTDDLTTEADIDLTEKTMSVAVASGTLTAASLATQLEVAFSALGDGTAQAQYNAGTITDENLANFDFTVDGDTLNIAATDAGDFAGDDDIRDIIGVSDASGIAITEVDATDGTGATDVAKLQIGANNGQTMEMSINDMRALELAVSSTTSGTSFTSTSLTDDSGTTEYALDLSTADKATAAIAVIDTAISSVSSERSALGSIQNRLEHTINNLGTASENLTAAESRVRDVDMAKEMMEFTKNNILSQAATSMLAQANQQPQSVLQLLR